MADKIVQLVDSEDNNIYPVAGALKDGSVTTSTINDGAVTADKIDFTTLPFGDYSLEEVDTGFTWVDGKPVFKKTVVATISGSQKVAHGISNFGELVDVSGSVLTSGGVSVTLPARSTTGAWINIWTVSATEISCETSLSDTLTWRINLRYTKSS